MGWSGMRNGELLEAAEHQFEVLITRHQNIYHQQHLPRYDLAVILLDTARMVPAIESVLTSGIEPGRLYRAYVI